MVSVRPFRSGFSASKSWTIGIWKGRYRLVGSMALSMALIKMGSILTIKLVVICDYLLTKTMEGM